MEYAVFPGGKRLRPILALQSARVLNGNIKAALPFACAIEFTHNFSLVHDDLPSMDDDDMRRGRLTCHKKFGEGLAILAGDGLLNLAFGIISSSKENVAMKIARVVARAIGTGSMMGGQALDLKYKKVLKKSYKLKNKIDTMKTASLMAASCEAGALAAKGKASDVKRIRRYGKNLGLAFQIADDIEDSPHKKHTPDGRKKEVKVFISKAKKVLAPFGKKADTLMYIADSILCHCQRPMSKQ